MLKIRKLTSIMVITGAMLISGGIFGCSTTQKPSSEETGKLEEARAAAESAERKLSELRQERMRLEQELQNKTSSDEVPAEE
ncbi:MAG: hypothetical protein GX267_12830 [Fibrobacter sp.]|jgi:hypothetical protein|nr:hypothetical protein [Fibrobacter sp.]